MVEDKQTEEYDGPTVEQEQGSVYLDFRFERYTLTSDTAIDLGKELMRKGLEAGLRENE